MTKVKTNLELSSLGRGLTARSWSAGRCPLAAAPSMARGPRLAQAQSSSTPAAGKAVFGTGGSGNAGTGLESTIFLLNNTAGGAL
jgi:hypothetical protein